MAQGPPAFATAGSAFTFTFTITRPDSRIVWIGAGAPGQATITFVGGPPSGVDQADVSGDRSIVWEGSDPPLGTHTLVITNVSGTIAIDGIVVG